ncbi:hypothetical protein [Sutcliffiella sp. NC1]|uniref:hypothetical protein n=1 Tax=Sutcliffiella sp. NC1 TaxID=3004096 RepID=UPI0022DE7BC6|nr:hypothetical protein [Sutcliffiella sp. NC1]WBL16345.1 hypothetical protein O1A01_06855 [Sutcliffiella sp. NC1]
MDNVIDFEQKLKISKMSEHEKVLYVCECYVGQYLDWIIDHVNKAVTLEEVKSSIREIATYIITKHLLNNSEKEIILTFLLDGRFDDLREYIEELIKKIPTVAFVYSTHQMEDLND